MKRFFGVVGVLMALVVCENGFGLTCAMAANVSVSNASGNSIGGYATIQEGINACPSGGIGFLRKMVAVPIFPILLIDRLWMKGYNGKHGVNIGW